MMFRSDLAGDGGFAGGTGGASNRKSHPIFKVRAKQQSEAASPNTRRGSGSRNVFICNINLNDSDPRIRPPICCGIVGFTITGLGIAALLFRQYSALLTTGVVFATLGGGTLLISFVWLFTTRRKIARTLALKDAENADKCFEYKDSKSPQPCRLDPIMSRALVTIYYRSCEDTWPYGTAQRVEGTKIVQVVSTDSFIPVESTSFNLIGQIDNKNLDKTQKANVIYTDTGSDLETGVANTNKGRTLPARPTFEKTPRLHIKSVDLNRRMQTPVTSNTESCVISPGYPAVQPVLSDQIAQSTFSDHPRKKNAERSYLERQLMLNHQSNVYATDLNAPRTLK